MKVLDSLISMIQKFPYGDPTYANLHEDLDRIRGKFKQVCPLRVSWVQERVQALGVTGLMAWGLFGPTRRRCGLV